jgi:MGT family glycosyltransferase
MESVRRAMSVFVGRAALELGDLGRAIAEEQPDLLLVDTLCWGAQAVAETSGLPWATWHPYPMPIRSKDAPPFGPGLKPAAGPLGRLRDWLFRGLSERPVARVLPELNRVRTGAGARPLRGVPDLFHAPPLLLHLSAEPFEYPRSDWPAHVKLVGPGLWSPPSDAPAWLERVDKPIVLVTCSTEYQRDNALIEAAFEAFGSDSTVQLVCTTAGIDPKEFKPPPGVILERFIPHAQVLPKCCAVVCHGGMGITQRALAAKVAPCVVPWGRDQLEVAQRVVQCGAGSLLSKRRLDGKRLRAAVDLARSRKAGAERVSAAFLAAGGAERMADLLEGLAKGAQRQDSQAA